MRAASKTVRAFTLIETLVVISLISLLIAILLPALGRARDTARVVQCSTQLRQIGMGFSMYAQSHKDSMPYSRSPSDNNNTATWWFNTTASFTDVRTPGNMPPAGSIFWCPEFRQQRGINGDLSQWSWRYDLGYGYPHLYNSSGPKGVGGDYRYNSTPPAKLYQLTKPSHTMFLIETRKANGSGETFIGTVPSFPFAFGRHGARLETTNLLAGDNSVKTRNDSNALYTHWTVGNMRTAPFTAIW